MADLSHLSDEELMKIVQGGSGNNSAKHIAEQEDSGFLKSALKGYGNYYKGALKGMGQSIGDIGASAINWPISGIEHLSGRQLPHVPHPHLLNEHPESLGESIGQSLGQFAGSMALPGGAGFKTAQLANRGYQGLRSGQQLPLIAKLLAGGAGGALEGAAGNEENRRLGAKLGGGLGVAGHAIPAAINFSRNISSSNIAKNIQEEIGRLGKHFNERFTKHLEAGELGGANEFLRPERANVKLLKKAGEGKLAYGIEKFNDDPTLSNAHKAQSDLNRIVSKYSRAKEGSLEADVYDEALKLKNRMLKKISEAFERSGSKEHGEGYQQSRVDYAKNVAPYLESPAINALLGKNKRGIQTVRPGQFADKLLQEEEFLAQAGNKHPELLRREKFNKLKKNKLAQGAALGAGTLATGFLPYAVSKALGLK